MKKSLVVCVILVCALAALAAAEPVELTDTELAGISAAGFDPSVVADIGADALAETSCNTFGWVDAMCTLGNVASSSGLNGIHVDLAPTHLTIDDITHKNNYGTFYVHDLDVKVRATVNVRF